MWIKLAKVAGYLGATLVMVAGGSVVGLALRPPLTWWSPLVVAAGLSDCALGWVLLEAALQIGKPAPGIGQLPRNLRNYAPRVLIPCDVCITVGAVVFCRTHSLYACLSCANRHDHCECIYNALPILGLECEEIGVQQ